MRRHNQPALIRLNRPALNVVTLANQCQTIGNRIKLIRTCNHCIGEAPLEGRANGRHEGSAARQKHTVDAIKRQPGILHGLLNGLLDISHIAGNPTIEIIARDSGTNFKIIGLEMQFGYFFRRQANLESRFRADE